jgi:hypothetical protein
MRRALGLTGSPSVRVLSLLPYGIGGGPLDSVWPLASDRAGSDGVEGRSVPLAVDLRCSFQSWPRGARVTPRPSIRNCFLDETNCGSVA